MKKWRFVIIILLIAVILLILPVKFSRNLRNYTWVVLKPIGLVFRISFGRTLPYFSGLFHLNQIISQNSSLVAENSELESRLALATEVENENEVLKKELGFMQTQDLNTTTAAAVIGRSSDYLKTLTIDKGSTSGIISGDAVISQGVLIGTVSEVREQNSDVTLITDYNSLVPTVLQTSRGTGLLHGGLAGLTVQDIPLNITIVNGENVVTSGLGGQIPQGILIGKVTGVTSKKGDIFQIATLSSSIDFSHLGVVFVLK